MTIAARIAELCAEANWPVERVRHNGRRRGCRECSQMRMWIARALYWPKDGYTEVQIAEALGVDHSTVSYYLREARE